MASAKSYSSNMPSVSTPEAVHTGGTWSEQIAAGATGIDYQQIYQNALTENNRAYEQAMLKDARDYETWFDSTAVQRRVDDIKAAGLNPWLALQSGGISPGSSSSPSAGSSSSAKRSSASGKGSVAALAMLFVSTARLLATL